jgi:hypothetical protein
MAIRGWAELLGRCCTAETLAGTFREMADLRHLAWLLRQVG